MLKDWINRSSIPLVALIMSVSSQYVRAGGQLVLEVELAETEVLEKSPLVALVKVRTVGADPIMTIFPEKEQGILAEYASLILKDEEGRTHLLNYRGGTMANYAAPVRDQSLGPGEERTVERLFSLVIPTRRTGGYSFLPPGNYVGHAEVYVNLIDVDKIASDEFALTILEAQGADKEAAGLIQFRHAGFLDGRDPPLDKSHYDGRKWYKRVDISRFGELQRILEDYPDSEYAYWIRYWKTYHHGSDKEALEYARTHRDFSLSDNLMFRVIRRVSLNDFKAKRALELIDELLQRFPGGDTKVKAIRLRDELRNKRCPGR